MNYRDTHDHKQNQSARIDRFFYILEINEELLIIGVMVENAIFTTVEAVRYYDPEKSRLIQENNLEINRKCSMLENQIFDWIASRPVSEAESRFLSGALEIGNEDELLGDYTKRIATFNLRMGGIHMSTLQQALQKLTEQTIDLLRLALIVFTNQDSLLACQSLADGKELERAFESFYQETIRKIVGNARRIEPIHQVIWIIDTLERLAERIARINLRTIYTVTGAIQCN